MELLKLSEQFSIGNFTKDTVNWKKKLLSVEVKSIKSSARIFLLKFSRLQVFVTRPPSFLKEIFAFGVF